MMHQQHRHMILSLQLSQVAEDWGDILRDVLVRTVHADQRIQDQQYGSDLLDCLAQALPILGHIQEQTWRSNDID